MVTSVFLGGKYLGEKHTDWDFHTPHQVFRPSKWHENRNELLR